MRQQEEAGLYPKPMIYSTAIAKSLLSFYSHKASTFYTNNNNQAIIMKTIWLLAFSLGVSSLAHANDCQAPCDPQPAVMEELRASSLRTYSYSTPITLRREAKSLPQAYAVSFNPNVKDQDEALHTQHLVFQREKDAEEGTLSINPLFARSLIVDNSELRYFIYKDEILLRGHVRAFYTRKP